MRGGELTGNGHVVAARSKRYTGWSVPAGSSRVPVTLRLAGAPGGGADWIAMSVKPSGPSSMGKCSTASSSEPPTACTVNSPLRDQTSLATVRSAGRSSGVIVT